MDGQIDIDHLRQVIRLGIGVFGAIGLLASIIFPIRWLMNGKARRNVVEMTPGLAPGCEKHKEGMAEFNVRLARVETEQKLRRKPQ